MTSFMKRGCKNDENCGWAITHRANTKIKHTHRTAWGTQLHTQPSDLFVCTHDAFVSLDTWHVTFAAAAPEGLLRVLPH